MKKLCVVLLACLSFGAYATEPIRLIVPFAQGGIVDQTARIIQQHVEQDLNINLVVEYRAGASGEIGTAFVANADPKELIFVINGPPMITTSLIKEDKLTYKENQLVPLVNLGYVPFVLVASKKSRLVNFTDFLNLDANRSITYGSSGTASSTHLAGLNLSKRTNKNMIHVPYKGSGQALPDLVGGHIDVMPVHWPVVSQLIQTGQVTALAIESDTRIAQLPNVPTFREFGISNIGKYGYLVLLSNTSNQTTLQKNIQQSVLRLLELPAYKQMGWIKEKNAIPPVDFIQSEKNKFKPVLPLLNAQ